ncbi:MAG: HAD family hydrolase [Cryobacterium sp.]|nr:HAD family hydrolase [Cryobacterium sp.]
MTTALIFDVFGTLLHFKDDERPEHPWQVLAAFLDRHGSTVSVDEIRGIRDASVERHFAVAADVYPDIDMRLVYRELVDAALPGHPDRDSLAEEAAWEFRVAATEYRSVYAGAHSALAELGKRYRLAIASNTQRVYTERELAAESLDDFFEVIVFSSDVERVKPEPLLLERTLSELDVAARDALYIGDNPHDDYVAATAAGIPVILLRHEAPYDAAELGVPRSIPIATDYDSLLALIDERA